MTVEKPPRLLSRAGAVRVARMAATFVASVMALTVLVRPTEDVVANGETRTLSLMHMHTGETLNITFRRNGSYDPEALKKLNWFLRDWRREEPTRMDPRLFDTIWLAYRDVGATEPVHVVCGYRAPETNAMLRRRSRGVAKFSQHTLGKAMDFYIPGVNLARLRAAGLRLQRGGVGYYPTSGSPFVHMDAGSVRMWPRMTRSELAAVFPDGKTVHIPADGRPMPGYQAAYAELQRNGGSVGRFTGGGEDDTGGAGPAFSFGLGGNSDAVADNGGNGRDNPMAVILADARRRSGAGAPAPQPVPQQVAMVAPPPAKAVTMADADEPVAAAPQRSIPVPLPEPRPAEIAAAPAAPQLNWVTGPSGQVTAANVPLPPARPGDDEPDDEADAAPDGPSPVADAPAPLPAASPVVQARASVPLPPVLNPQRPVMADAGDIGPFGRTPPAKLPTRALGFADPSIVPAQVALPPKRPALIATRFEKLDFTAVSTPVSSVRNKDQAALVRPDLKTVATLIPAPSKVVVMRFGTVAYQDLSPWKFSGAAIKPLRTASFATMPDIFTGSIAQN